MNRQRKSTVREKERSMAEESGALQQYALKKRENRLGPKTIGVTGVYRYRQEKEKNSYAC